MDSIHQARLAQSVEHQTLNWRVVGSNPTVDKNFFILYFVASDALLAGRLAPCKWNQAWRPSELYMCIEREKVDFKSREVNCLKECALALSFGICFAIRPYRLQRFLVRKLFFSLHDNRISCSVTSLLHMSLQICILFKIQKNRRFW